MFVGSPALVPGGCFSNSERIANNNEFNTGSPCFSGGLHLMDLDTRVKVSSIQWLRRLIKKPDSNSALTLRHLLRTPDLNKLLMCKRQSIPKEIQHSSFYSNVFQLWNLYHSFPPSDEVTTRREILWDNKFITNNGTPLYWKSWITKGVVMIQDICHVGEGPICSHVEIAERFGVRCSFLDAMQLRLSIPLHWRTRLTPNWHEPPQLATSSGIDVLLPGEEPIDILFSSPKSMYRAIIAQSGSHSTAFRCWSELDGSPLQVASTEGWSEMNWSVHRSTRETKLQSLHFKILNRILPCNSYLKQIHIKDSDECSLCGQVDSIPHFLRECPTVQTFWRALCPLPSVTKFFVYRQRLYHGGALDLLHWLREFKQKLLTEKFICR